MHANGSKNSEVSVKGVVQSDVMDASSEKVRDVTDAEAEGAMERVVMDETAEQSEEAEVPPDDIVILYHTLVQDSALPAGYEREFATLARAIAPAAAREQNRTARLGTARSGNTKSNKQCNRPRHSSSGRPVKNHEGSRREWKKSCAMAPRQDKTPRKQSVRDGCRLWPTWCVTHLHPWASSWQHSRATWESWEKENVPRRCGHVYGQSRSSSTGSTSLTACSTLSQCSTIRSTCGCACQNRATEEH